MQRQIETYTDRQRQTQTATEREAETDRDRDKKKTEKHKSFCCREKKIYGSSHWRYSSAKSAEGRVTVVLLGV